MASKILFLDRDGTLVEEPEDKQVDSPGKVRLMPGVIPALLRAKDAGFEFVVEMPLGGHSQRLVDGVVY